MSGQSLTDLENGRAVFIPLDVYIDCGFSMTSCRPQSLSILFSMALICNAVPRHCIADQ